VTEVPLGVGVDWIDHVRPSHCSTSGVSPPIPTAVQAVGVAQDTLSKELYPALAGAGAFSIDHLRPFQRSASGNWPLFPTATQTVGDGHDTPVSMPVGPPAGPNHALGVGWSDQLLPSQRTTSGRCQPTPSENPTAVHAVAKVHDAPNRVL
jgi:hypothetical protein